MPSHGFNITLWESLSSSFTPYSGSSKSTPLNGISRANWEGNIVEDLQNDQLDSITDNFLLDLLKAVAAHRPSTVGDEDNLSLVFERSGKLIDHCNSNDNGRNSLNIVSSSVSF